MLLGEGWPVEAIDREIAQGVTHRVALKQKVPVYLVYLTAFVDTDGTVEFRNDVYGRDERLSVALARKEAGQLVAEREVSRYGTGCPAG